MSLMNYRCKFPNKKNIILKSQFILMILTKLLKIMIIFILMKMNKPWKVQVNNHINQIEIFNQIIFLTFRLNLILEKQN